jgi:hypothetical protein
MNKKLIANIIHTLLLVALAVVVWMKVHWSVALFCIWLSLSVYVLVSMQMRMYRDLHLKLKAVRDEGRKTSNELKAFIDTFEEDEESVQEMIAHPEFAMPRPLKITPASVARVPKFEPCTLCVKEGNKTTEFKQGNCPVHN